MSEFEHLSKEEQKHILDLLDKKLEQEKPTKKSTLWYEFSVKNKGFEFMNIKTGKTLSKIDFFNKFWEDEKTLNKASQNVFNGWRRVVKVGWIIVSGGYNVPRAIPESDIPTYKKNKKQTI